MRIAMLSTPFLAVPPAAYGGTELIVHELTEGLPACGVDVTLFATGDSHTSAELRSLYPRPEWPPEPLADVNHVSWAMAQVQRGGFDLVHAHSAMALALGRLAPQLPIVYTVHHEREEHLSAFYRYFPEVFFVTISDDQRSREIPFPRGRTIHHGLDPHRYEWTDRPGDYLACIGRLSRVKGPHTAIDVARAAGLQIRVAGEVHDADRAFGDREMADRLRQPHVEFLGPVGIEVKRPLLRDARALLAPLEWNEPFGLVMIEATLSGCPVVAFPRGSVPELVEDGVTGFVARGPEEMIRLVRRGGPLDSFDRRRCRARAVERFSRDRMVRDYARVYRRVLDARGGWRARRTHALRA